MTKKRALGIAIVALLVLPFLAVGYLLLFFPTERATAYAIEKVEASTGRPLAVGHSSLKIVPNIRLVLEDVAFGDEPAPGAPRVTVDAVELGVRLMPLLSRRVEVTRLAIDRPIVEAVLAEEGDAPPPKKPATSGETGGVALRIDELVITRGGVVVRTPDGEPFVEITGLDERLTASASATGDIALSGTTRLDELVLHVTEGEIGRGLALTLSKSLRYDAGADRLDVLEAQLDVAGVPIALTGHVDDVGGEMAAALELKGGPGQIESILGLLPAGLFPEMAGMQSSGTLSVNASVTGPLTAPEGPAFLAQVTLEEGRIQYPKLARAVEGITLRLKATPERVEVTELAAHSASSTLRAHATISDYRTTPNVQLALDCDIDLADIAVFYPNAETFALSGAVNAQVIATGPPDDPDAFAIDGTVEARNVGVTAPALALPVEGLSGGAVFDRNVLTLQSVVGRIGSSDFAVSGRLENPMALDTTRTGLGRAHGVFNLRSEMLNVDELMPQETGGSRGGQAASGAASTASTARIPPLPPLDATVTGTIGHMLVKGVDARNVAGRLALEHDVLSIEEVTGDVFQGRAALGGSVSLIDRTAPSFDLTVDATDCNVVDVFSYNRDLGRLATVAQHLSGTMTTKTTMRGALDDTLGVVMSTLASDGDVWVQNARLAEHPVQVALSRFLGADRLKALGVEEIVQSFSIRDGRLTFDDLNVQAGPIAVVGNGWSSIDGQYEMGLDLWLPRELAEGAREKLPKEAVALFFGGNEERLMLPVTVKGRREERPSVALDSAKLTADAQARAAARLEAEKQRLAEEAKARAKEAAAGLIGTAKPDSVPIQEAAKEQVEEKVKDALKGLFGKTKK